MHQYFLHDETAMTLFNWPYQSDGWSLAWELLIQFFHNKIYNPQHLIWYISTNILMVFLIILMF